MTEDPILGALRKHFPVRLDWLASAPKEETLDPEQIIIDPHHHAWDNPANPYMFNDILGDFTAGHNIVASVAVQAHAMYRSDGPEEMKPVGETEFLNGMAAQSASGMYGDLRLCKGIVGAIDLEMGAGVEAVLDAHMRAAGPRFKGVRPTTAWHESDEVRALDIQPHLLMQASARAAIQKIADKGLSLDLWVFYTQLEEALDVARRFPELPIILNHCGGPLGIGPYEGKTGQMFPEWSARLREISARPNVNIKLGGLGMRYAGFRFHELPAPPSSDVLASHWSKYILEAIDIFGTDRCMFESNYPVDRAQYGYHTMWNGFKKIVKDFSADEKDDLFWKTANRIYRLS